MPILKTPPGVSREDIEDSLPMTVGMGAQYISNIKGPIRQIMSKAAEEGKNPAKVAEQYLRGPYAPSVEDARRFAGKGNTLLEPVPGDTSYVSLSKLGGLLGILGALFSRQASTVDTSNVPQSKLDTTTHQTGAVSTDLDRLPSSDEILKMFSKPVGQKVVKAIKELAQTIKPEDSIDVIEAKAEAIDKKYFPELRGGQPARELFELDQEAPKMGGGSPNTQLGGGQPTRGSLGLDQEATKMGGGLPTTQQEFDRFFDESTKSDKEQIIDAINKIAQQQQQSTKLGKDVDIDYDTESRRGIGMRSPDRWWSS